MLIVSFVLVWIVYLLFLLMNYKMVMDYKSLSPCECGFDPNSFTRVVFSYRFSLISILFFDVEIVLMLPVPFLIKSLCGLNKYIFK